LRERIICTRLKRAGIFQEETGKSEIGQWLSDKYNFKLSLVGENMKTNDLNQRLKKEKELYNQGIDRSSLASILSHVSSGPGNIRLFEEIKKLLQTSKGRDVLEIGSSLWASWIDFANYPPKSLTCINISEKELQKGIKASIQRGLQDKIYFKIMDAHHLEFPDNSFDVIYGGSILHHLDLEIALKEFLRVLKPGGEVVFFEPLGINPFGNLIRVFTPKARTPDEKPFDFKDLKLIKGLFGECHFYYYQLLYIVAGVISRFVFKSPNNFLTRCSDKADCLLERIPLLNYMSRIIVINCKK
jgi:ubiquinone/menaquinone biosynthesis C-methylase UbiE